MVAFSLHRLHWIWSNGLYILRSALLCPKESNRGAVRILEPCLTVILLPNVDPHCFHALFLGTMNSLSGKSVLSLCRQTTKSIRLLANSTPSSIPLGHGLTRPLLVVQRVCHSAANSKPGSIRTKKRGYDITRNPHLNKVMSLQAKKACKPHCLYICVLRQSWVLLLWSESFSVMHQRMRKGLIKLKVW